MRVAIEQARGEKYRSIGGSPGGLIFVPSRMKIGAVKGIFCDMVQKTQTAPRRGRPRAYDPDTALRQATAAFWGAGYSATSLYDLCAATGMNRPSLYGAFGDKRALYRHALQHYRATARVAMGEALLADQPLADALRRFYRAALGFYFSGEGHARGCFLIGTTLTEA